MDFLIERSISKFALKDLDKKLVLISGPRQVGKTYLSKSLSSDYIYLNYDNIDSQREITERSWPRNKDLIIFDELHKMTNWKQWLKGIYDVEGVKSPSPKILVTGSARLDTFRKMGDSLAGRYYLLHLLPLSVNEVSPNNSKEVVEQFLKLGQFPEPFLSGSEEESRIWRKTHLDIIIRQDLLDLENVSSIKKIERLVQLLADRVGSGISYANIARDLEVSAPTIKSWIQILEELYVIYLVRPFSKTLAKSILKEPKIYFFDIGQIKKIELRLENLVANHLYKKVQFLNDTMGLNYELMYFRDKEKREVDFILTEDNLPVQIIEVKTSDDVPTRSIIYLKEHFQGIDAVQLVHKLKQERFANGIRIMQLHEFLSALET
ncbi:MAG: ATP-binding protein [Bacteriovorax sp.]|nr:ATP-binding protein [Bacteriovorax sp.]